MSTTINALLSGPWRRAARSVHRDYVFRRAMRALVRDPVRIAAHPGSVLTDLMYGWGNEGWAAKDEFLQACMQSVLSSSLPVLECGSGLSTLVLGVLAQHASCELWSIEHLPEWAQRVRRQLDEYRILAANVMLAPLQDFGAYDWYAVRVGELPARFGIVVCDGPPSQTRGGRVGLVPRMKDRLAPGCLILLDDAERDGEQAIARQWVAELRGVLAKRGVDKPFFELRLAGAPAQADHRNRQVNLRSSV